MSKLRIVHLSDIHVWRFPYNPFGLLNKRVVGFVELVAGRARRFRLERLDEVVREVHRLTPDHVLITGDLTTLSQLAEFQGARRALGSLLEDPARATVVPGNHDRYTSGAVRSRAFEAAFGAFAPQYEYPWLRQLDGETAILGLDPTRSHITATGYLPLPQLDRARALVADPVTRPRRLVVACHYPLTSPPYYRTVLAPKRLKNAADVAAWIRTIGPHLFCCGHVHAAWAYTPPDIPLQLCLNAGAPLLRDPTGFHLPGFLVVDLDADDVAVTHQAWTGTDWLSVPLARQGSFFEQSVSTAATS